LLGEDGEVSVQPGSERVRVDESVLRFTLDEALSNARKYG